VSDRKIRSPVERIMHWLTAISVVILVLSGIEIYRAAPFFAFKLKGLPSLGGDLTTALLWHFAAMWGLGLGLLLLITRRALKRGVPIWPISLGVLISELRSGRLPHDEHSYNQLQRIAYLLVYAALSMAVVSGLALWKPVQMQMITDAMGGYEAVRRWHFGAMLVIAGFTIGHGMMALAVPRTIIGMIFGLKKDTQ
jgi:thiosulfate reductase cytochrome b subunit